MFAPIQGDSAYANTVLLLRMDGANNSTAFLDESATPKTITRSGSAEINTTVLGYPVASILSATNDYLTVATHADFAIGTGDYTIAGFFYSTSLASNYMLFDFRPPGTNGAYPAVMFTADGTISFYFNSSQMISSSAGAITAATVYAIALCRSGSSTRLFVNGTQVGSTYTNSDSIPQNRLLIGGSGYLSANQFNGYIPGFRVVRQALYTANFTPPTVKSFLTYGSNWQFCATPRFQPSAHLAAWRGL